MSKRSPGGSNLRERKAAKERYLAERARHREKLARRKEQEGDANE